MAVVRQDVNNLVRNQALPGGIAAGSAIARQLFANTARGLEAWHQYRGDMARSYSTRRNVQVSRAPKRKASENNQVRGKKQRTWDNRGRGSLAGRMRYYAKACLPVKHYNQYAPNISFKGGGTMYTLNLLSGIPLGSTYSSREGDVIDVLSIKLKLRMDNGTAANTANTKFLRMALIKHQHEYDNAVTPGIPGGWQTGGTGFIGVGGADLYMDNTSYNDVGIFDPKRVTVLWETRHLLKPNVFWNGVAAAGAGTETYVERTIKVDQKFVYNSGQKWGKTVNYYMIATVYDYGSTAVNNVSGIDANFDILFKDAC